MIAVLTDPGVGGTFLTWSLHYLAGHEKYYHAKTNRWVDIPSNPLTDRNSHGFNPNQPFSLDTFNSIHSLLLANPVDTFHTIYFHNFGNTTSSYDDNIVTATENINSKKYVVLTLSQEHQLYMCSYKIRSGWVTSWNDPLKKITDDQEALDDFVSYFFKESIDKWQNLSLTNIWDQREFLALNLRPKTNLSIRPNIDFFQENYALDTMELWNTFDLTVDRLFEYLDVTINEDRRALWNTIYSKWRQLHYNKMLFVWYFNTIIEYIIAGTYLDLTRFNLDIIQEATIQHELIYKHNLNLKTWQLEKFINTLQLHKLLELNIHDLSKNKI